MIDNNNGEWFHFFAYLLLFSYRIHPHLLRGCHLQARTDAESWSFFEILGVCRLFDDYADDLLISSLLNSKKREENGWI
jgi:hypothetical protein